MNIQEISIKKLYGYIDKNIVFKSSISILVGINGSGKTSILNLINWLLRPNIRELCLIEFENVVLKFRFKLQDYLLTCTQNKVKLIIELENLTKNIKYNNIEATFHIHPSKLTKNEDLKSNYVDAYDKLTPESHERETWEFIFSELPTPVVIGLDRNLYTDEGNELRYEEKPMKVSSRRTGVRQKNNESLYFRVLTPLDRVKQFISSEQNTYRNKMLKLYGSLNEKIMMSSFDELFTRTNIKILLKADKPTLENVDILNGQVVKFLEENQTLRLNDRKTRDIARDIKKVNNYFKNLKNILNITQNSNELLYLTNINQFKKISDLIIEFKSFEEETKRLYSPLQTFLDTINAFFVDSAKELYYDFEKAEIRFNVLRPDNSKLDGDRDVKNLSSGEKQILILFAYIKYNINLNVFIIDEPELSLHPKWQGELLDAVDKLMPKGSQLIIATHSPEIIGNKQNYCTVLLPM